VGGEIPGSGLPLLGSQWWIPTIDSNRFQPFPTDMKQKKNMDELDHLRPDGPKLVPGHRILLILDSVRSMHNVGAAFRTGDAMGVDALYLCGYTPRPPHRDIHKTALGATETVPWKGFDQIEQAMAEARSLGYTLMGVEQIHGSIGLHALTKLPPKIALVFGNEVDGLSAEALKHIEAGIEIPQFGKKHSLNLAVSMGMVLWEISGRKAKPAPL